MKVYDLDRLVKLTTLMSRPVDQDTLFDVVVNEAMTIGNCDGGTIYTIEDDKLYFRYIYTKSKGIAMNYKNGSETIPPVPMRSQYVCAYAAMHKLRLNIRDVYTANKFDFTGTRKYDEMNSYRTCSMLVIPMLVGTGDVMGVLQLINSMDRHGLWTSFSQEQEERISAIGSIAALYLENLKLKGMLESISKKNEPEKKQQTEEEIPEVSDNTISVKEEQKEEKKEESGTGSNKERGQGFWTFRI